MSIAYNQRHAREGFTLIEILVALAIVVLIAAIAGPMAYNAYKRSQVKTAKLSLKSVNSAIQQFNMDIHQLPETLKDLVRKPTNEELAKEWNSAYLQGKDVPKDPWNNDFQYRKTEGEEHPYELYSYGPNGRGAPQTERISVWNL
ncbi:MAG TPA: type II secretion system major pseudopilin GspG [Candidatus Limnocylindria bacterium]|nr:type II secretion system major pseudopilin GspG [Candidatus Limnocylindria bacterium]